MGTLYKRVELFANVAIILVAIAIGVVLIQKYFFARPTAPLPTIAIGSSISLPIEWGRNGKTLVLALQTGCHFCSESAPFYRRLAQAAAAKDVKVVAVFPQPPNEGHDYLNTLSIPIVDVRQAPLSSLRVSGTPTLILVNEKGEAAGVWIGKLPSAKEAEVLARL